MTGATTTTTTTDLEQAASLAIGTSDQQTATYIITQPGTSRSRVFGDDPVLKAAISVAVAAGSDRRWVALPHGVHKLSVIDLPAVVREVAEHRASWHVRVGVVRTGNNADAVVLWFGPQGDEPATVDARNQLIRTLADAAR